jgi:hypothetical protein
MEYSKYAQEYTPELLGDFYSRLARPVREETLSNIGLLRGNLLKRGLAGTPMEALGTAYIQSAGINKLADLMANLQWQKAGWQRQERLADIGRRWQEEQSDIERKWRSQEAEKERAFRQRMAELQRKWEKEDRPNLFEQIAGKLVGDAGMFALAKWLL